MMKIFFLVLKTSKTYHVIRYSKDTKIKGKGNPLYFKLIWKKKETDRIFKDKIKDVHNISQLV